MAKLVACTHSQTSIAAFAQINKVVSFALEPCCFFVAWRGVLVLSFNGFPESTLLFKENLVSSNMFKDENLGSKWPKCTIGCLKDEETLSKEQFVHLKNFCASFRVAHNFSVPVSVNSVQVNQLSLVELACRSLAHVSSRLDIELMPSQSNDFVSEDQKSYVSTVLEEQTNVDEYMKQINAPGNRFSHYEMICQSELTLVSFLQSQAKSQEIDNLVHCIRSFREGIERLLPGKYHFFEERVLHVTVRAMNLK